MADDNLNLEVTGFESLRAQIREATLEFQRLRDSGTATAAEIDAAAARVGKLKDEMGDAADTAAALGTAAGKFGAITKGLGAVAGGFTAIQGAITLAGGDAKDFEKTMQKVQGAMALSQGLSQLSELGDAFGNMKKVAVGAFNSIKTAIGSTGIGLLVVALGAIYAYWDDIKAAVSGVSSEQEELNKKSAENLAAQEKQLGAISEQENILKLQGMSEEQIYQLKLQQYDQTIAAAKANVQNLETTATMQIEAAQRNQDILKGILDFLSLPLKALLSTVDAVGEALGQEWNLVQKLEGANKEIAKFVFDPEAAKKEADKTIDEAKRGLTKLENDRAGMILQNQAKKKAEAQKALDDQKAANDKENDLQKEHLKNLQKLKDDQYVLEGKTEEERAQRQLEVKQRQQRDELQILIDGYTAKKKLTKEEEESLAALRKEYDQVLITQKAETDALTKKQADDKAKKDAEDLKKSQEDRLNALKDEYEKSAGLVDNYYKQKETALLNSDLSEKKLAEEMQKLEEQKAQDQIALLKKTQDQIALDQKLTEEQKLALTDEYSKKIVDLDNQVAQIKKANRDKEREETIANFNAALDVGASLAQGLMDLDKAKTDAALANQNLTEEEREKIAKESFEKQKKLQYAMALIDAAKAVTSIIAQYPKFDGGIAMTAALITTGITTAVNIAKIASTQYQSKKSEGSAKGVGSTYAMGGLLGGPSHDLGGIKTSLGELEGGEFVVNRRATMDFMPLLNQINATGQIPGPEVPMNQPQPIIKTYVVASEMTSQQEANAKLESLAKL